MTPPPTPRTTPLPSAPTRVLDPALWDRLAAAFEAAADLAPDERARALDRALGGDADARAEVEAMLAAHDRAAPLRIERKLQRLARTSGEVRATSLVPGTVLGPYQIEALVREGGMGEVYRAERVDGEYRQTVAVKVLRASVRSSELVRRFQVERQILARLAHPDIAPILDGGVTADGRPYLVMQFIDGLPITEYCDRHAADVATRLRLFGRVADAVQYAHGRLVVHRDLKPSNILVTADGEPKLLDFGIAKVLAEGEDDGGDAAPERTQSLLRLLTPEHAAPEQLRGEPVTTATDVYSLGVLLYQLLAGRRPYAADGRHLPSLVRAVLDEPVAPPSAVAPRERARQIRGDLDHIVLTALRKEPERRYESAGQFAEDVERFLDGRTVRARRDTLGYRARRFVARNRLAVGAGLALAAVLVASSVTATLQSRRVARERDRAERERQSAEAVVRLLTDLFERSNPTIVPGGDTLRVAALLEEGERKVDALASEPALQARMWRVLGNMHAARGRYARAIELLGRSAERQRALGGTGGAGGADDAEAARTDHDRARVVAQHQGAAAARAIFDTTIARLRSALGEDAPDVTAAMLDLASATDDLDQRRALLDRVVERRGREPGVDSIAVAGYLNAQGGERYARGRHAEAVPLYEAALRVLERSLPPAHPHRLSVQHNLAASLSNLGEWTKAESLIRQVLDQRRRASAPDSGALAITLENWATIQAGLGRFAEAESAYRDALAIFRRVLAPNHARIENALRNVGLAAAAQGRVAEGLALLDSALASARARDATDAERATYLLNRPMLLLRLGRTADAVREAREADRIVRATTPVNHPMRADADLVAGGIAYASGDPATALARWAAAREHLGTTLPPHHPSIAAADCGSGMALAALGRHAEAAAPLATACPIFEQWAFADPLFVAWARKARQGRVR